MRICYFYAYNYPDAIAALPEGAELIDVSNGDFDYWSALGSRWDKGEDLVVIEQDILVRPDVIESFIRCGKPWCSFAYWYDGQKVAPGIEPTLIWHGLGCTKFSAYFQSRVSFAPECPWIILDMVLRMKILKDCFEWTHVHGTVEHVHDFTRNAKVFGHEIIPWVPDETV